MGAEFARYLLDKMQSREQKLGRRISISEFADWLQQNQPVVSNWMNGKYEPSYEKAVQLAPILGYDIFDVLKYARPDKRLAEIHEIYDLVPDDSRDEMLQVILDWAESKNYVVEIKRRDEA